MPTPTTPQVLAAERIPPMFRPNNQANLVPATPLNPAASMSFMPGLGAVRSGNIVHSNGLDPVGDEELAQWRAQADKGKAKAAMQAKDAIAQLERQKVSLQAKLDGAKARGMPLPRTEILKVRRSLAQINNRIEAIRKALKRQQGGGNTLAPWFRKPVLPPQGRSFRPLHAVNAPVTPDPLRLASPATSYQSGQSTIKAMQNSVSPVKQMPNIEGLADLGDLGAFPNIPTPLILAGVAAGVIFLAARKGKRR